MKENLICAICGKEIKHEGFEPGEYLGNNPWPVVEDENARCCDLCNETKVIPARLGSMFKTDKVDTSENPVYA